MPENMYSLDMEVSILASVLYNNDILSDLAQELKPSDFYSKDYGDIFEAMLALFNKQQPIDDKFIALEQNINKDALNTVIANSGVIDVQKYAKAIKEMSNKRAMLRIAQSVPALVNEKPVKDAIDELSAQIYELANDEKSGGLKDAKEASIEAISEIKRHKEEGTGLLGISSGFSDLDFRTQGLKKGDFIIIAARPGMGKTTFALNIVEKVLENGEGVVFFSLEMPSSQLIFRMLSSLTSINLSDIMKANLSDDDIERLSDAADAISSRDFYIYDRGDLTVHVVRAQLRRLMQKIPNISLCVIDYIGLMTNSSAFSERHLQIAEISRQLKLLARELQIPIIALSQLNRSLESRANKRPMLSDLRESGAIEQDADIIMFVYRKDFYKEQEAKEQRARDEAEGRASGDAPAFVSKPIEDAEIIIGKNRNGPTGAVEMSFDKAHSRFIDIDHRAPLITQSLKDE